MVDVISGQCFSFPYSILLHCYCYTCSLFPHNTLLRVLFIIFVEFEIRLNFAIWAIWDLGVWMFLHPFPVQVCSWHLVSLKHIPNESSCLFTLFSKQHRWCHASMRGWDVCLGWFHFAGDNLLIPNYKCCLRPSLGSFLLVFISSLRLWSPILSTVLILQLSPIIFKCVISHLLVAPLILSASHP